ncbi:XRE family transcriptional regulator [Rhodococcus sp. ABRD24]|uniref:helix-turn-helix domain-containing protein n=1 Tax=Rhodococcus sp. ABRD24 TaxID=2507582 RepID=UPI001040D217|nr:XRE family transcriptional regulator [Rhodococcus sp. ABRD24]QBJ95488.1 XRE family transcriptional regulator [Rhodococcus sp. ABRD24]
MDSNGLIARNVQRFRGERQMSMGELAKRANLSKQTLSKIEQGVGNPTVETIDAIAEALDVPLRRLVTEWGTRVFIVRASEGTWAGKPGGATKVLDQIYGSGYVRTSLTRLRAADDAELLRTPDSTGTLIHAYVIAGRVRVGPANELTDLDTGDFVQFPSDVPHVLTALSAEATVHIVTTMPQVPQFGPLTDETT